MDTFGKLLKQFREEAQLSQRALARASEINPAIISRMENGERGPSGPEQVLAIIRALSLSAEKGDALLASAGFWPRVVLAVGPRDDTLLAVATVLTSARIDEPAKERFRRVVRLLVSQWVGPQSK